MFYTIGVLSGALGDVLLIFLDNAPFLLGTLFFLSGHVFYMIAFFPGRKKINKYYWIGAEVIAVSAALTVDMSVYPYFQDLPAVRLFFVFVYLLVECNMLAVLMLSPRDPSLCPFVSLSFLSFSSI